MKKIIKLNFNYSNRIDLKGRLSIADVFTSSKKRCGIYLLEFSDGTFYIGQAIDIVRRIAQHRKSHDHLIGMWFQEVRRQDLNEVEQSLIQKAEGMGIPLINRTFVKNVSGETDLDLLISAKDQELWLTSSYSSRKNKSLLYEHIERNRILRYRKNFQQLKSDNAYPIIKQILKLYISRCIPEWQKTEMSFWSLSCLPSTNINRYPRYFCLNINAMEVLVFSLDRSDDTPVLFLNISDYFNRISKISLNKFTYIFKGTFIEKATYRAASGAAYRVYFEGDKAFRTFLKDPVALRSIRELNLRLMRKGGTMYSPYHCFDLVNNVMN